MKLRLTALVANKDKDYYSQSSPTVDNTDCKKYALNPELAVLLKLVLHTKLTAPT